MGNGRSCPSAWSDRRENAPEGVCLLLKGTFQQAKFAADRSCVHDGTATPEYQDAALTQVTGGCGRGGLRIGRRRLSQHLIGPLDLCWPSAPCPAAGPRASVRETKKNRRLLKVYSSALGRRPGGSGFLAIVFDGGKKKRFKEKMSAHAMLIKMKHKLSSI